MGLSAGSRAVALTLVVLLVGCANQPLQTDEFTVSTLTPRAAVADDLDPQSAAMTVLWGGVILSSINLADSTRLEILAYPLDRLQRPLQARDAQGRFVVDIAGYVETADYAEGRLVTILGTLTDRLEGTIGEARYRWPLIQADQWHLWRPGDEYQQPRFTFGIGVNLSN